MTAQKNMDNHFIKEQKDMLNRKNNYQRNIYYEVNTPLEFILKKLTAKVSC